MTPRRELREKRKSDRLIKESASKKKKRNEFVKCNLCGSNNERELFTTKDRRFGGNEDFRLVQCEQCGLAYLNPRPRKEEIGKYYPNTYSAFQVASGVIKDIDTDRLIQLYKSQIKILSRAKEKGRILDVGCGEGFFLKGMYDLGWKVCGVEINHLAASYGTKELGVEIFRGELQDAIFPENYFDVVTLMESLEHMHDPLGILELTLRILKKGGFVYLTVPNYDSLVRKIFRTKSRFLEIPRHLYHFTPKTLQRMLEKAGYRKCFVSSGGSINNFVGSAYYFYLLEIRKVDLRKREIALFNNPKKAFFFKKEIPFALEKVFSMPSWFLNKAGFGEHIRATAFKF